MKQPLYKILSRSEGNYRIALDAENIVYKAHFPGKPITPGVCIIDIATELISDMFSRELRLKKVQNVKFISVISPLQTPEVTFSISDAVENDGKISAKVEAEGFAKMTLILE